VDIMEKQGKLLADRPRVIAGDILTGGLSLALAHAGDRLRQNRRFVAAILQRLKQPSSFDAVQSSSYASPAQIS
jgi:hypothetical protein